MKDPIVRVPGPDFIINNGLADYALNKSMILIDAFSEVRQDFITPHEGSSDILNSKCT